MVSRHMQVDHPVANRRLVRSIQSSMRGTLEFKRRPNSIYCEEQYSAVFLEAVLNNNKVMMNGASKSMNLRAKQRGQRPKYTKGGRNSDPNSEQPTEPRYYPAGKTILWHIKNEYEIVNGLLHPTLMSSKRVNLLERKTHEIIGRAARSGLIRAENQTTGVTLAFDYSDQDFWGLPNSEIIMTRAEGTATAYRYGLARFICPDSECCLPPIKIDSRSRIENDLQKVLQQAKSLGVPINTMLLDRAFFNINVMNLLRKENVRYIMPAKVGSLKRQFQQIIRRAPKDHVTIHRYPLGHEAKHSATTFLVVVPPGLQHPSQRQRRKHLHSMTFATSIQLKTGSTQTEIDHFGYELSRIYRLRFGIETDWSVLKTLRPRTTSPSAVVRLFYFYVSVLLYDAWVYARQIHVSLIRSDFLAIYVLGTWTTHDGSALFLQSTGNG